MSLIGLLMLLSTLDEVDDVVVWTMRFGRRRLLFFCPSRLGKRVRPKQARGSTRSTRAKKAEKTREKEKATAMRKKRKRGRKKSEKEKKRRENALDQ